MGFGLPQFVVLKPLRPPAGQEGIRVFGEKVIRLCLEKSRAAGRRILIDVKHTSPKAREDYYRIVKDLNKEEPVGNPIAIISTHSRMSGFKNLHLAQHSSDKNNAWKQAPLKMFNPWPINLCNDDIRAIHDSKGMLGIELDQRILGDLKFSLYPQKTDDHKLIEDQLCHPKVNLDPSRFTHTVMFMDNLFHVIKVINQPSAWDVVCLGSDFDGNVDPIEGSPTSGHFNQLLAKCKILARKFYIPGGPRGDIKDYLMGLSLNEALTKFFSTNLKDFTLKHFP